MMKRFWAALLALLMVTAALPALVEDTVPNSTCFSPGLELLETAVVKDGVEITARFTPEAMLSANKNAIAVLQALFENASVVLRMNGEAESAQLCWNDAPMADFSLLRGEDGVAVASSILPFPIVAKDEAQLYHTLGMNAGFAQMAAQSAWVTPVHLALPTASGEMTITQEILDTLSQEGHLAALKMVQPLHLAWTINEKGILSKASMNGAVQLEGEGTPWVIDLAAWGSGSKMSIEGTVGRDEKNTLDVAVSITYATNKATRKEKAGHDVDMRVKLGGKLGGYSKTLSATLKGSNRWVREEETGVLNETIKQSVSITYTDKDPAASKANTANISVSIKDNGTVLSGGTQEVPRADFKTTVLVEIGQYTLLEGVLNASMRALVEGEAVLAEEVRAAFESTGEATADEAAAGVTALEALSEEQAFEMREEMEERIARLMHTMYPTLDAKTHKQIKNDLE